MDFESAAARAKIGRLIKGRWRIDALLAIGGMGWVYAATHKNLHRVALKMLSPALSHDPESRERFLREGYVANAVDHPGTVRVFDDDIDDDGTAFLVMELLDGADLETLSAARGGRIDPSSGLQIARGVLDVLVAAHAKRIVHRDIKPGNVFCTRTGQIKLLDFGIAHVRERRTLSELTSAGSVLGSYAYMAPEQARAEWNRVDGRTDLWALGATLFRVLSGHRVHEVTGLPEQLWAAGSRPARSLASAAPGLPEPVVEIVDRALRFEPDARFANAEQMRSAIDDALVALGSPPALLELPDGLGSGLASPSVVSKLELGDASTGAPTRPQPLGDQTLVLDDDTRARLLGELARFGIHGKDVHFIDTIPLLEMIWADGQAQAPERRILEEFLEAHVLNINELAGEQAVTLEDGQAFVERFLRERPPAELLETLRGFMVELRVNSAPASLRDLRRRSMLDFCLDIGASCVATYPHGDHERFCKAEKIVFERIFRALGGS